jgi:hypothetical protein
MQIDTQEQNQIFNTATPKSGKTTATKSSGPEAKTDSENEPSVIEELREKGFMAYVEEIHKEKMEELRAKILESMGLSEEQLGDMPAQQRGTIEDMIAEKIKRIMMVKSAMNDDHAMSQSDSIKNPLTSGNIQNGTDTGLALLQAMENSNTNVDIDSEEDR